MPCSSVVPILSLGLAKEELSKMEERARQWRSSRLWLAKSASLAPPKRYGFSHDFEVVRNGFRLFAVCQAQMFFGCVGFLRFHVHFAALHQPK